MEDEPEVGFILGIKPVLKGNSATFPVESRNFGIHEEIIITVVRSWLKKLENEYFQKNFGNK